MRADSIFAAIERHGLADAAWDDSINRSADGALKSAWQDREHAVLIPLLRPQPLTVAGALAMLRHIADYAENKNAGLFSQWRTPLRPAGAAFLPMIADTIEAIAQGRQAFRQLGSVRTSTQGLIRGFFLC